ncbi:MAG: PqiC family protein [Bdellovibrionota bacterium]
MNKFFKYVIFCLLFLCGCFSKTTNYYMLTNNLDDNKINDNIISDNIISDNKANDNKISDNIVNDNKGDNSKSKDVSNAFYCKLPRDFFIEIGPVQVLDYLKREQIIIREDNNKIKISDTDLWITDLENQIRSVLKLGLKSYITYEDGDKGLVKNLDVDICEYPCVEKEKEKLRVSLVVNSFEYDVKKRAVIFNANFKLYLNKNLLDGKTVKYNYKTPNSSYKDIVYSMSEVLSLLVKDIAKVVCEYN